MKIAVITNEKRDPTLAYTAEVAKNLHSTGAKIFIVGGSTPIPHTVSCADIPEDADCVLILGGDGSIMRGALAAAKLNIPVLGVNLGRVGYLAEVDAHDLGRLAVLTAGEYITEERMLLEITCGGQTFTALNDAVISRRGAVQIAQLELSCSSGGTGMYRCDGIIVATPTGSTAYSMSAGGPIIDPAMSAICVTPVCAHSLFARPMVLSADEIVTIKGQSTKQGKQGSISLTVDGVEVMTPEAGMEITVRRSAEVVKFLRLGNTGFFDRLKTKL
ncbi:MAG: NAD(+)/NADH kinase [Oscillospiraceae bacterium]|nr:NAD(+)/NADH kinase [Oscillospiraceae bacterium]